MEGQAKAAGGFDGYQGDRGDGGCRSRAADCAVRVTGLVATLVAAVVMGVAKEDTTIPFQLGPGLPSVPISVTAKSSYSSAFVYFTVANSVACAYATLSLALSAASGGGRKGGGLSPALLFAGDLLMLALLLSGNGAAAAIGVVGRNGNPHVRWNKICNVFGRFCGFVTAAVGVSLLGCLAFALLLVFAFWTAHRRSQE